MCFFVLAKCAKHHPHHVLPKIFAIFNAFKDEDFIKDAKQKPKTISSSPRTDAAGQLLQKLKADTGLRDIIVQLERMYEGKDLNCLRKISMSYSISKI